MVLENSPIDHYISVEEQDENEEESSDGSEW